MNNQKILDDAPEGAGVSDITGEYFDEYNNHLNKQGFWSEKDTSPVSPRSLADIKRIVELEKALSDLIERAAQRDSWKYFPESYLDEAFKVLLKEQGK